MLLGKANVLTLVFLVPQIEYLVQEGGIKVLGELLKQSSMVMMALEGLERILEVRCDAKPAAHRVFLP